MTDALERGPAPVVQARRALAVSVALTVLLPHLPYARVVARPLVWLSTLAHELGHGFAALLIGANFERFVMYANASGAAVWTGNPGRVGRAFIAAGGLVGPAVVAAACFLAARTGRGARVALGTASAVLGLALVLWVRSLFGFAFVAFVAVALGAVAWRASEGAAKLVLMFLGVQLAVSVFTRSDYLFMAEARTGAGDLKSDVAQIADALLLPYWFWGGVVGAISVAVLALGLWLSVAPSRGDAR